MHVLVIATDTPLQEALSAALSHCPEIHLEQCTDLLQANALCQAHPPDLLLVLLPLPSQQALLLPQWRQKILGNFPILIAGEAPPDPSWSTYSNLPYMQVTTATLPEFISQLHSLSSTLPPRKSLCGQLLTTVAQLTSALFTEFTLETLLQRIIEEAIALIPDAQAGSLLLEEGDAFTFRAFVGYVPELRQVRIPGTSAFIPRLRQGEIVHVHNIMQSNRDDLPPDVAEGLRLYGRVEEIHETLAAPLLRGNTMIGYITVDSFSPGTQFNVEDQEALGYLASIATIAIHNAQLLAAERTARMLAETVGELGRQIVASLDVQNVLTQILDALFRLTPCDAADILFIENGDAVLVQQRLTGPYTTLKPHEFRLNIQQTDNLSRAAQQRHPVVTEDTYTVPGWIRTPETAWIRSHIAAPFYLQGELAGFLCVSSAQPQRFSTKDCEILAALLPLVTIAIQNAGLFEKEHAARRLAETLQKIGTALSQTLNVDEMISIVAASAAAILPYTTLLIAQIAEPNTLQVRCIHRPDATVLPTAEIRYVLQDFPLLQEVSLSRNGICIADISHEPRWRPLAEIYSGSLLLAPMHSQGQTHGLLLLHHHQPSFYKPQNLRSLQSLADLLMIALSNAQLFHEVQQARQRAEEAYENLRRLDAMKSQFIQNVSHELRTPLAIVKGYLDLVLDTSFGFTLEPNMEQALKAMQTHTNRLATLVESITTLENVEAGQLELHPQPILPVFLRAIKAVRQKAERYQLELVVDLDPQLPQVNLDPQQMGLALWHLLDNAIKFNRPKGHIWIQAWAENDEVFCSIRDEGIGIPPEEHRRIFERFYQVDGSTKRRYEGMGLGLSIAREVLEKHGGRIWVDSAGLNTGATFTIALPIYHEGTSP